MSTNLDKYKKELIHLIDQANILYYNMAYDLKLLTKDQMVEIDNSGTKIGDFKKVYQEWYTKSLAVIKQVIPDRLDDFIILFKNEKRKITDFQTYTMSDYLIGLQTTRGIDVIVNSKAGFPKFEMQKAILEAAESRFESTLYDLRQIIQADLFDTELEEPSFLCKNGYLRAAGAIAGVVLESHLSQVSKNHNLSVVKKNPAISDYNDLLKEKETIDIPTWRFIQHLGDIRNLCDHKKTIDPTIENINDLIAGVSKITKTLF
jgi:hypothetical protein